MTMLSRQEHSLRISTPIPANTSREDVISALHDHVFLMTLQPLVMRWEEHRDRSIASVKYYTFTEAIPILPFLGSWGMKDVVSEATFENTSNGVRSTADAPAGVVVSAEWRVDMDMDKYLDAGGVAKDERSWVLTEDVSVECSRMMMWYVKGHMEHAHRDMCKMILEKCRDRRKTSQHRQEDGTDDKYYYA